MASSQKGSPMKGIERRSATGVGHLLILSAALMLASGAHAQSPRRDPVAAETLFEDARKLMNAGKYADACPRLEESQRLDPGVGTLMYLGLCYEQTGRSASAWSTYRSAESAATHAGQAERAKIARDRANALAPKLLRLVIRVTPGNPANLEITRDGVPLGQAAWGVAVPVDPGKHTVTAAAPGRVAWNSTLEVMSGTAETLLNVPLLQEAPLEAATALPKVRNDAAQPPSRPQSSLGTTAAPMLDRNAAGNSSDGRTQRWFGLGLGAAGLVGVGIGTVFALESSSKSSDAEKYRIGASNGYRDPGYDLNQQALDAKKIATIGFAVGGAALVGGAVLFLTAPKAKSRSAQVVLSPEFGRNAATLGLGGVW
jgi:tetratricopeptide (TPR) repeat protein